MTTCCSCHLLQLKLILPGTGAQSSSAAAVGNPETQKRQNILTSDGGGSSSSQNQSCSSSPQETGFMSSLYERSTTPQRKRPWSRTIIVPSKKVDAGENEENEESGGIEKENKEKGKRRRYQHNETGVIKKDQAIDDTGGAALRKLQTLEGE